MSKKIFISYRRDDSAPFALTISSLIEKNFGEGSAFIDVDLQAGIDFVKELDARLAQCRAIIVVIGKGWVAAKGEGGALRLHDEKDWVRLEIERALARGIPVFPVLVDGAVLPRATELPASMHRLLNSQAISVRTTSFRQDASGLIRDLRFIVRPKSSVYRRFALLLFIAIIVGTGWFISRSREFVRAMAVEWGLIQSRITQGDVTLLDGFKEFDLSGYSFREARVVSWNSVSADLMVANQEKAQPLAFFYVPAEQGDAGGIIGLPDAKTDGVIECPIGKVYEVKWYLPKVGAIYCLRARVLLCCV